MADIVEYILNTVDNQTGKNAPRGVLNGLVDGKEIQIQFDQVMGLATGRNANMTNYAVGSSATITDYYSPGPKSFQLNGFFSTWQGKDLIEAFLVPSIMERDKQMDTFMDNGTLLTLKVGPFTYQNLMITSYSMKPSNEELKVDIDIIFMQRKTFNLPAGFEI